MTGTSTGKRAEPIFEPRMRWPSAASQPGSNFALTPFGGMPTITAAPCLRSSEIACSDAPATPTVTNTKSTFLPPLIATTRSATFSVLALTPWVAPNRAGRFELGVGDVDRDDRRGAGDARALHAVEADAAAADDDHACAGVDFRGVDDGAEAGEHAAGDQRRGLEGQVAGDFCDLALVDDGMFGERAGAHAVHERLALGIVQRRRLVERKHLLAIDRAAARAGVAEAAGADQRRDDMIAGFYALDAGADRFDDSRGFMAEDRRQVAAPGAVGVENVAVADRAGLDLDPELAGAGLGEFDLFDAERLSKGAADGGAGLHLKLSDDLRANLAAEVGGPSAAFRGVRRIFV